VPLDLLLAAANPAPPLTLEVRLPLSILNFLEFAVWGAWFVVLGQYLEGLKFSRAAIGRIYATMALGTIVAPIFGGSIADRYFSAQQVLGVLHLVGAGLLLWMAYITTERKFYWVALAYALAYSPTLALTNAVVFSHIPDANRDFPMIRVLGTIGWIAANLALKLILKPNQPVSNRPLLLAAALSAVLGVYSFFVPDTPAKPGDAIPFLKALSLFEDPSFAVFLTVSFLITIALAFYYSFTSLYLEKSVGVRSDLVGPLMTIGQWVEIGAFFCVAPALEYFGMKGVLMLGMAAWGIRYGIFSLGGPLPLIVLGLALHGFCFDFFFAAGFIHVENASPADILSSAQSLFTVLTYGLGMYLGTEASGWLNQRLTRTQADPHTGQEVRHTDWRTFWAIPAVGVLVCLVAFWLLFRTPDQPAADPKKPAQTAQPEPAPAG
jgi:nucleoside transporter